MQYLIDTHTLIWYSENTNLSEKVEKLISDSDNKIFVSVASLWEIAIKVSIGKLVIVSPLDDLIKNLQVYQFNILPVSPNHVLQIQKLAFHHRDPFDRMIISQAMVDDLIILGADEIFDKYEIKRIW